MDEKRINNEQAASTPKRAILCAIHPQNGENECLISLHELERLLETAGGVSVAYMTQMREAPDTKTVLGSGKVRELSDMCTELSCDLVIFDCELSPSQIREIENAISEPVQVIDRSMLILDIFADHARTAEGRLQVELAQLRYTAPRLVGHGKELSRLGGTAKSNGIGSRGPGETKLEIDRRRMKEKINALESELEKVAKNRQTMRNQRERSGIIQCGIVGYTNAGKSTLLNALTGAGILAEDKLFATLDTTTKQYQLPGGVKILLTDTVGFIRNLPHHLIKAFRSTLEEAVYSDILMIVIDASDPEFASQVKVTTELLSELGAGDKPILYVFNKCDQHTDKDELYSMKRMAESGKDEIVFISAKTGAGLEALAEKLEGMINKGKRRVKLHIPPEDGAVTGIIYQLGDDVDVSYEEDGIHVSVTADEKLLGKIAKYIIEE
ncbi:MAG: GTPase HflX [Clostridia bacterium]|nr:GTPase HflX [Clostridia bacterium]